jgi:hypothetical protein
MRGKQPYNKHSRAVAHDLHTDRRQVWNVLHEQLLRPYHRQTVHTLLAEDFNHRLRFARWLLRKCANRPEFLSTILFTDEAVFNQDGIYNTRNSHIWADVNPRAKFPRKPQHRYSVNVWAGIVGNKLIGPYLLPSRLNGLSYEVFLRDVLPGLLEDVPLAVRANIRFQHDGAPPHFTLQVREYLTEVWGHRWIGRGGPVAWPARSPDLTPLDYFLWGHMKQIVYAEPVLDDRDLVARIAEAAATIRARQDILINAVQSLVRRCQLCVENHGAQIEHQL